MGSSKTGLVLAGGGAKGAYQAGALQYLNEIGFAPDVMAGTSIGALNGAVLACFPSFSDGVAAVNRCWERLGSARLFSPDASLAGLALDAFLALNDVFWLNGFLSASGFIDKGAFFDSSRLEELLREFVDPVALAQGTELWVTIFPAVEIPFLRYSWLLDFVLAKTGAGAEWISAQYVAKQDPEQLYSLLLASAAIPLAFPQQTVGTRSYRDGGLADNVPLGALRLKGCTHAIVIHLSEGSVFNASRFPDLSVIEIRPAFTTANTFPPVLNRLNALLDFSADRITALKNTGYRDARRCLREYLRTLDLVRRYDASRSALLDSTERLMNDEDLA